MRVSRRHKRVHTAWEINESSLRPPTRPALVLDPSRPPPCAHPGYPAPPASLTPVPPRAQSAHHARDARDPYAYGTHQRTRRRSASSVPRSSFDDMDPFTFADEQPARKAQEPMSPVTVVLYVVFLYLVWQILTRSDDEILSHLPSSSPLLGQHGVEQRPSAPSPNSPPSTPYQFPYALPQLPPAPAALGLSAEPASSTWRTIAQSFLYPIYICVTLLAIPLPIIMDALRILASILSTILYPVTWTARLLTRTFILAPLNVLRSFLYTLYPVYVFVGGVVGVGAMLGVTLGWVGRVLMWLLLGRRSATASSGKKTSSKKKRSSKRYSAPQLAYDFDRDFEHARERDVSRHRERERDTEPLRSPSYEYERRYLPIVDYVITDDMVGRDSRGTGRETVVLGLRRRGVRA